MEEGSVINIYSDMPFLSPAKIYIKALCIVNVYLYNILIDKRIMIDIVQMKCFRSIYGHSYRQFCRFLV